MNGSAAKPSFVRTMVEATKVRGKHGEVYPHFTKDFWSTKSFGPGHIFGAAVLGIGLYATIRTVISRAERQRLVVEPKGDEPKIPSHAAVENVRGQYG